MSVPASLIHPILHPAVSVATLSNPAQAPFTPSAIRTAYGFDQINFTDKHGATITGNGAGQTIAIVDAFTDPNITGDLATFDSTFGLPAPPSFSILNENGGTSLSGVPVSPPSSFALEESIDVEWAHAIAPAANIVLFEASSTNNIDVDIADLTAATPSTYTPLGIPAAGVVSNSFGSVEGTDPNVDETQADEQFEDSNFFEPISAQKNVTVVAAAGDFGSQFYPSVSPYVLSVGGTALTLQASGTNGVAYSSETAWSITRDANSPTGFLGGGGGTSLFEPQPVFQTAFGIPFGQNRETPDVSIDASGSTPVNFVDSFDFPNANPAREFAFGTSIGAPMWAGLLAVVDQGRALQGKGPLANAQEAVYNIPTSDFHDITTGFNVVTAASPGYDGVTGLGTPIANRMAGDLVAATTGPVLFLGAAPESNPPAGPSGPGPVASGKAIVVSDNGSPAVIASRTVLESDATHLDQPIPGDTTPAVAIAAAGLRARGEAGQATALPGGRTEALRGVRADATVTTAASAVSAATGESTPPVDPSDVVTPTAVSLVDFATELAPAIRDGGARDAVFANLDSDPRIEFSIAKIEGQTLAAPGILAGEQTQSFDLAMMAGLALAVGGWWNSVARSEETRKFPALRK
jgi:hypothetical protein